MQANDPFGHWLAGFFDGEGCFGIHPDYRGKRQYCCRAKLSLRADDVEILREIQAWTGVGRVYVDKKGLAHQARGQHPCAAWAVDSKRGCQRLVEIFDAYPLRAKKARDYAVWSAAVREWSSPLRRDWLRMEELFEALRSGRRFGATDVDLPPAAPAEPTLFEMEAA